MSIQKNSAQTWTNRVQCSSKKIKIFLLTREKSSHPLKTQKSKCSVDLNVKNRLDYFNIGFPIDIVVDETFLKVMISEFSFKNKLIYVCLDRPFLDQWNMTCSNMNNQN